MRNTMKYAVSHSYCDENGWHEAEFVNVDRFEEKSAAASFILDYMKWEFHHVDEDGAEVYLYPGHLCTPPTKTPFLETQKVFLREIAL